MSLEINERAVCATGIRMGYGLWHAGHGHVYDSSPSAPASEPKFPAATLRNGDCKLSPRIGVASL